MTSDIITSQKIIKSDTEIVNYDNDTLEYLQKPIGKALYEGKNTGKKTKSRQKCDPKERITCGVCGKEYTRWNISHHRGTKYHKMYEKVNEKMRKLILDKEI